MAERLERLLTDLGERSDYDAASQCSRCGYCEQSCPTYVATGREALSPRGRNQLVRLLIEGKLEDPSSAKEALDTCMLCSACTTTCYAHVPTADIVLEGRRMLRDKAPWLARAASRLLVSAPRLFDWLLRGAHLAKRLGLAALARPVLRRVLPALAEAEAHVKEAPLVFLSERLRRRRWGAGPRWLYFAACGTNYLFPRAGLATVSVLLRQRGEGAFLDAGCCGLVANNYGELADARALAKRVIERAERFPDVPVVADCSSCVSFLKTYPQLFVSDKAWRSRAERFSSRVEDAVEALEAKIDAGKAVTYHESCRACHGQGLKKPAGLSCAPLAESDVCCGGAGAFAFSEPDLSDEVLRRKIGKIAESGAQTVLASSTSCLIQLARGLRKYYPSGTVEHFSEFVDENNRHHGPTPRA
jgi:glycolate oxidase iron-sulfur subunit